MFHLEHPLITQSCNLYNDTRNKRTYLITYSSVSFQVKDLFLFLDSINPLKLVTIFNQQIEKSSLNQTL